MVYTAFSSGREIVVGIVGAIVGVGMLWLSGRSGRRQARDEAREEAVQLANVRKQVIVDLNNRLSSLSEELRASEQRHRDELERLKKAIDIVREEAAEAQRILAVGIRGALLKLLAHLEADPAEVRAAIRYLHEMLAVEDDPTAPAPNLKGRFGGVA